MMIKIILSFLLVILLSGCFTVEAEESLELQLIGGNCHSILITEDGELWAWGHLPGGTEFCIWCSYNIRNEPEPIRIMDDVVYASDSLTHVMAIRSDGSLWGWGSNSYGQLGDGTNINKSSPVRIMDDVIAVSAGRNHTMAIRSDGSLWGWGVLELDGERGDDGLPIGQHYPIRIMDDIVAVEAGEEFTLVIKNDSSLWGWGRNNWGQLGDGTAINRSSPVRIMDDVIAVSANSHVMAIQGDGSLWGWGGNSGNAVGYGASIYPISRRDDEQYFPYLRNPVQILDDVIAVSTGERHTLAITTDGSLWAWGDNLWGQLGNSSPAFLVERADNMHAFPSDVVATDHIQPSPIRIMGDIRSVSAGRHHTLAITTDGILLAWGDNHAGQLGDETTDNSSTPRVITLIDYLFQ